MIITTQRWDPWEGVASAVIECIDKHHNPVDKNCTDFNMALYDFGHTKVWPK